MAQVVPPYAEVSLSVPPLQRHRHHWGLGLQVHNQSDRSSLPAAGRLALQRLLRAPRARGFRQEPQIQGDSAEEASLCDVAFPSHVLRYNGGRLQVLGLQLNHLLPGLLHAEQQSLLWGLHHGLEPPQARVHLGVGRDRGESKEAIPRTNRAIHLVLYLFGGVAYFRAGARQSAGRVHRFDPLLG